MDELKIISAIVVIGLLVLGVPAKYLLDTATSPDARYNVFCLQVNTVFDFFNAQSVISSRYTTRVVDFRGTSHTFGPNACYTMMPVQAVSHG